MGGDLSTKKIQMEQKLTLSHLSTKVACLCTLLKEHKLDSKDQIQELKWKTLANITLIKVIIDT